MCTVVDYGWIRWILHFYNKDDRIQDGGVRYCKQQSNMAKKYYCTQLYELR